jgi:hypothetical protein
LVQNWNSGTLTTPDGKQAANRFASNNTANYQAKYDYARALGRGIATISASYYSQHPMWVVNGIEDKQDLRHNSAVGNWVNMEDLKYSDKSFCVLPTKFQIKKWYHFFVKRYPS